MYRPLGGITILEAFTGLAICPIGGITFPRSVTIQMQIHILIQLVSVLAHVKGKIHTVIVQPALLYGLETVPMTGSHVKKMEVTKMKMSRWAGGHTLRDHTLRDHVRHYNMRERLKVENITERCRKARLRWSGRSLPPRGRRKRGRPKQRWMDCANRYMRAIGTTKDEVHNIYHFYLFSYFCIIFLHTNLPYFVKRPRAIVIDWALYTDFYYYYY